MWDTRDSECLNTLSANRPPFTGTGGISNPKNKNKTATEKKQTSSVYFSISRRPTVPADDFASQAAAPVQERWPSLTVCWSRLVFLRRQLLIFEGLCVRGIEFKLNNATTLIVPNKIMRLPAKTTPGICISGNPGWK